MAVVASDRGVPKEFHNGENGYIVDPEATEELAATNTRLLVDEELRQQIGGNGKSHVLKEYQVTDYCHAMEQVYWRRLANRHDNIHITP